MKKLLLAASLTLAIPFAQAEVPLLEVCKLLASSSNTVMTYRQLGLPMSSVVEVWSGPESGSLGETMVKLTMVAYGRPRFSTESVQSESIADFENEVFLLCIQGKLL